VLLETKSTPELNFAQSSAWRLLILYAPNPADVGRAIVLASEHQLGVARGEGGEGTFGLQDVEVSRQHAQLSQDGGVWKLRDNDSRNGTFIGGRRIREQELKAGDVLRLGGTLLLWQQLDQAACRRLLHAAKPPEASPIIGHSHEVVRIHEEIRGAAATGLPVLVLGESGVGKELVARGLHDAAGGGPFVPVNCAALPEALAESELFGHGRGAFTGATGESSGLFGLADGGSLFLDEVGEMRVDLQAKLLRALATGEVRGVGQRTARHVRVRVIAATNVDLERAVEAGSFRGDLYARIAGVRVSVPALRQRREDVMELARHFLSPACPRITVDAAEALLTHDWPWNVRELEHVMRALPPGVRERGILSLDDLPPALRSALDERRSSATLDPGVQTLLGIRRDVAPSRDELSRALAHFQGNVSRVAAFFARERRQVYRWAEQLGLSVESTRRSASGREPMDEHAPQGTDET
jgi:DNA-binding NtrC family response regulator